MMTTQHWLEPTVGWIITLLVLLDVFWTVLYARASSGLISYRIGRVTWKLFCQLSNVFPKHRGAILSLCGPVILVLVLSVWALLLTLGAGLVIHPFLGTGITSQNGSTPTDFGTALFAGGGSISIVGSNEFGPKNSAFRLFYLFNSFIGMSIISITLTYLLQIYNALLRRNVLGLNFHLASAETADAAELLAGLGPNGDFSSGQDTLSELASDFTKVKETHHFYPVLFYFRFRNPFYAVSRSTLIALDAVTLIKTALDDIRFATLKESGSVTQLWRASLMLVNTLEKTFLPKSNVQYQIEPDAPTAERWRHRYYAAARRLRQAGIQTVADEHSGAEAYIALRSRWDQHIRALAPSLGYDMSEIDPIGCHPETSASRPDFETRLRFAD